MSAFFLREWMRVKKWADSPLTLCIPQLNDLGSKRMFLCIFFIIYSHHLYINRFCLTLPCTFPFEQYACNINKSNQHYNRNITDQQVILARKPIRLEQKPREECEILIKDVKSVLGTPPQHCFLHNCLILLLFSYSISADCLHVFMNI